MYYQDPEKKFGTLLYIKCPHPLNWTSKILLAIFCYADYNLSSYVK